MTNKFEGPNLGLKTPDLDKPVSTSGDNLFPNLHGIYISLEKSTALTVF
jgi:hypothetical protein